MRLRVEDALAELERADWQHVAVDDSTWKALCPLCLHEMVITASGGFVLPYECKGNGCSWEQIGYRLNSLSGDYRLPRAADAPDGLGDDDAPTPAPVGRVVEWTQASTITPRAVRWAWEGRIPLGNVTVLGGHPGLGKSTLTVDLIARMTRGELAGHLKGEPADAILVSYEDDAESTITPRLTAAGADRGRVWFPDVQTDGIPDLMSLPDDVEAIADAADLYGARLVVVDPVVAALSGKIDAHRDQDVRRALSPLAQLAERQQLAVLVVMHFNKGDSSDALKRLSGSIGFGGAARSVLTFGNNPDDPDGEAGAQRALAHAKCNVGPKQRTLIYGVQGVELPECPEIKTSRLVLLGESDSTARDMLGNADDRGALDEAIDFLRTELENGPVGAKVMKGLASEADVAGRTLERAKKALGVKSVKQDGGWFWQMPESQERQGGDLGADGDLGDLGDLDRAERLALDHPELAA